jgi:hypothetical protein
MASVVRWSDSRRAVWISDCTVLMISGLFTLTEIFERYGVPLIVIWAVERGMYIEFRLLVDPEDVLPIIVKRVLPIRIVFHIGSLPSGKRLEDTVYPMTATLSRAL